MSRFQLFLLGISLLLVPGTLAAQSGGPVVVNNFALNNHYEMQITHWYYQNGDNSVWALPGMDIQNWQYLENGKPDIVANPGVQWYRAVIELQGKQDDYDILALYLDGMFSAFDLYWDGHLLDQNGQVGHSWEKEVPGLVEKTVRIKRELTIPGRHVLALRISNFHNSRHNPFGDVAIGYHYSKLWNYSHKGSYFLFKGGALLIAGLFCIAFFFAGGRHRTFLFFAVYSFTSLFFDVYPTLRLYSEITAGHLTMVNWLTQYGRLGSLLFLAVFYLFTFDLPKKKILLAAALVLLGISFYSNTALYPYHNEMLPLFSIGILVFAIMRKKPGSIPALVGLVFWRLTENLFFLPKIFPNPPVVYLVGEIIFLFSIFLSISRDIHEREKQLQDIKIRSLRLEADLIKKQIQPHFILNTLQSITNWIAKKPGNAQKLIEALAKEFKMVNQISDKTLVPIKQEIELCNTHLEIMGFRMGTEYTLQTEGPFENDMVPPMIFHTLIENALTHAYQSREAGTIRLKCMKSDRDTIYRMTNGGSRLQSMAEKSRSEIQEGMGIKYIRVRLEESYPGKWQLDYNLTAEQWSVTITIHDGIQKRQK